MSEDEKRIRELHAGFCEANKTGDVAFLRAHMAPGAEALTWFNLNQSNYLGVDHICELWDFLRGVSAGKEAQIKLRDERISVRGDAAWVVYQIDFRADFGAMGKVAQDARCTEIWERQGGDWRMVHFHCSNHVPGQMGGI
jgi:ketosteroid isomerase-like protein